MLRLSLKTLAFAAVLGLLVVPARAQMHHEPAGSGDQCTFCAPWLFVDGAALWRADQTRPSVSSNGTTPLVRARFEAGSFIPHVGIFSTMEIAPKDGPSPTITAGVLAWVLPRFHDFNVTGGLGIIDTRQGVGESTPGAYVVRAWGQLGAQYGTPLHELTVYVHAGVPFSSGGRVRYQLGISHPIAPYKLHIP
ncbi:MAG: hypothetical protein ACREMM_07460 [Gemmatimonadales bacterium]